LQSVGSGWDRRASEVPGGANAAPADHARETGRNATGPRARASLASELQGFDPVMARVAMIVDEMFEDSELRVPFDRLREAGHEVVLVGLEAGKRLVGKRGKEKVRIERAIDDVDASEFDALVIPGGYSPDKLRTNEGMVALTRSLCRSGRTVAAVCHAPWMLAEADVLRGKTVTSWPSIKTDLKNAGARWTDREVVVDGNLITSRKPEDLEAFSAAILDRLGREGDPQRGRRKAARSRSKPKARAARA
jgi:protease I